MARKRRKLVPDDCVEVMEIRVALYWTPDGSIDVDFEISDPDNPAIEPPLHEVLGVVAMLKDGIRKYYRGLMD